jgi:regulator of sirC expression with transglutaminase-like and TPR domain
MDQNEVKALISLLEDPDEEVFQLVTSNLEGKGEDAIPLLEKAWHNCWDQNVQNKLEDIIQRIQHQSVDLKLRKWIRTGGHDLLEGCFYVEKMQYPDLQFHTLKAKFEEFISQAWLEMNDNLTALEKVRVLNYVLFKMNKFRPNKRNFYSPLNNFIYQVLESRKGNPLSLSIVYSIVAQELEIPIFGVNLPKNFILAYVDKFYENSIFDSILFYINPYKEGAVLSKLEIDYFLKQQDIIPVDKHFEPCDNITIVNRLLKNLRFAYKNEGKDDKANFCEQLLQHFPK